MDDVCIIGYGAVGKAFAKVHGIYKYFDLKESNITLNDAAKCKYIIICLPTPTIKGTTDTSHIEAYVRQISDISKTPIIVIRSTVPPGTAKRLMDLYEVEIVSNPEFLTESTAEEDMKNPDIVVLGAKNPHCLMAVENKFYKDTKAHVTEADNTTAETIKYAINCFYALKVIYATQLYEFCQRAKVNYEEVKESMYHRKWIGDNHMTVPFKEKFGVGGKCLGKDLESFATLSNMSLLLEALKVNLKLTGGDYPGRT